MQYLLVLAVFSLIAYLVYAYNSIIKQRFIMEEGWSGVDVQLRKRHDLIPNLVELTKAYASHEKETLDNVTRLRSESSLAKKTERKSEIESSIGGDLKRLIALVEAYPDLKADKNFRNLQESLVEIEDQIQYARRYFNGTVRDYNTKIETFPTLFVAKFFDFKPEDFFEVEFATERSAPEVRLS